MDVGFADEMAEKVKGYFEVRVGKKITGVYIQDSEIDYGSDAVDTPRRSIQRRVLVNLEGPSSVVIIIDVEEDGPRMSIMEYKY